MGRAARREDRHGRGRGRRERVLHVSAGPAVVVRVSTKRRKRESAGRRTSLVTEGYSHKVFSLFKRSTHLVSGHTLKSRSTLLCLDSRFNSGFILDRPP